VFGWPGIARLPLQQRHRLQYRRLPSRQQRQALRFGMRLRRVLCAGYRLRDIAASAAIVHSQDRQALHALH
jgi:hypothetical protein